MFKKFLLVMGAALVASLAVASTALAWHVQDVKVYAKCNTTTGKYDITVKIVQSAQWPNAYVKNVNPTSVAGNAKGAHIVVKVGWKNSNETQTIWKTIGLDGKCVKYVPPTPDPEPNPGPTPPPASDFETIFACYSAFQVQPGAWPKAEAVDLYAAGYYAPEAVPGNIEGGTNIGAYNLQCNTHRTPTGFTITAGGFVFGPDYGPALIELGFYKIVS